MLCINLYRTTACDAKNDKRKLNTIASYATKKFGFEYRGFLLRFCTQRNEFNCVFRSKKLRKYAIRSLIWSYGRGHVFITKSSKLWCFSTSGPGSSRRLRIAKFAFACIDALRHSQQFISHVRMISCLPGLNQYQAEDKVSCSIGTPVSLKLGTLRSQDSSYVA